MKRATVAIAVMNENDLSRPFEIIGSGFCIHRRGVLVTCRHVLEPFWGKPWSEISAALEKEGPSPRPASMTHPTHALFFVPIPGKPKLVVVPAEVDLQMAKTDFDIALLRVRPHRALPRGFPSLEIEEGEIHEGMSIATCGFPLGNVLSEQLGTMTSSFTQGIVSSILPAPGAPREHLRGFQLNIVATNGNSGGPVFVVETGKVFGAIECGPVCDDAPLPGIVRAVPLHPALEHDAVKIMLATPPGELPPEDWSNTSTPTP